VEITSYFPLESHTVSMLSRSPAIKFFVFPKKIEEVNAFNCLTTCFPRSSDPSLNYHTIALLSFGI
jgi:hypothetical protein